MSTTSLIIVKISCIILGLIMILVISLPEINQLKKLKKAKNYESGIVTEVSYRHGYKRGSYSVHFISEKDNKRCIIREQHLLFDFGSKYKTGDRVNLAFNDSGNYCAPSDDIGKMLLVNRVYLVLGLFALLGGIFISTRKQPDSAS